MAVSKLKRRFNIEVTLKAPKVPYRETIRGKADAQGKHKKQTGGHGQYGDCWIKMEPLARGGGFEFVNDIFGGAIPRNFIPAVEKGIVEAAARGYLAGYPGGGLQSDSLTTAPTTTWTPPKSPSSWPAPRLSRNAWNRPSPACSSPS